MSRRGPSRPDSAARPSAATRRSTALTSPAKGARRCARASATAVATAACGGRVQQQQARGTQTQDMAHRHRRRAAQMRLDHRIQAAQPAQHGGGEAVRRGAVAGIGGRQRVQRLVQRTVAVEHGAEQGERGLAGRVGHGPRATGDPAPAPAGRLPCAARGIYSTPMLARLALLAQRRPRALLVAYCLLCWLPGWFTIPATDRDESRFAQATKQMIETGDFIDIRNGTEARNRKPIGIYWLQAIPAAAARGLGIAHDNPIWPYRLPSLLGALIGVLATYGIGRRLFDPRAALLAAFMLGGSALLAVEAHLAKTDAALLGATTLAMGVLARAYLAPERLGRGQAAVFWFAVGAGVLLKGPITPIVAGLAAITLVIADRDGRWLGSLRPRWGVPLALVVVLPWLVAIELSTQGRFLSDAVGGDLGRKLAGGDDAHGAPPGAYLLLLSLTLFPAGFAVLRALPDAWHARRDPVTRFLLAWAVPSWLVFELVPTKLPHYVLPLYPALCLIGASWIVAGGRTRWRWLAVVSGLLFVLAALVFGGGAVALPLVTGASLAGALAIALPALLAAALVVGGRPAGRRRHTARGLVGSARRAAAVVGDPGSRAAEPAAALGLVARRRLAALASGQRLRRRGLRRAEPDVCRRHRHALARPAGGGTVSGTG